MSLALSGADAAHLAAAAGLTYALGFERALRGALAGDRVFALIGTGSGVVGIIAAHLPGRVGQVAALPPQAPHVPHAPPHNSSHILMQCAHRTGRESRSLNSAALRATWAGVWPGWGKPQDATGASRIPLACLSPYRFCRG